MDEWERYMKDRKDAMDNVFYEVCSSSTIDLYNPTNIEQMEVVGFDEVKCSYCGQWGKVKTNCLTCGAPMPERQPEREPETPPTILLPKKGWPEEEKASVIKRIIDRIRRL